MADDVKREVCALENEHQWMKKALWKSLIAHRNGAGYVTRLQSVRQARKVKNALGVSRRWRFRATFLLKSGSHCCLWLGEYSRLLLGLVCEIRAHKKCVIVLKAPITGLHGAADVLVAQLKLQQIERVCLCLVSLAR